MQVQLDQFIQDVARESGAILKDRFHHVSKWRTKTSRGDVVTEVDEASENLILSRIREHFPDDSILSEESGKAVSGSTDRLWIIDPLDGTRNYLMQVPFFCVSIGVAREGKPYAGGIYDPIHDELFFAERKRGAYLNGEPISVSKESSLEDSVVSVSWVRQKVQRRRFVEYIQHISKDTSYFRRFGSAALVMAYVACGRLHAYLQGGLNPWDVAAGVTLIEEAGGQVTNFEGSELDVENPEIEIVTANPNLHSLLVNDVIGKQSALRQR